MKVFSFNHTLALNASGNVGDHVAEKGAHVVLGELRLAQLKDVERVLRPIWLALFDPAFQPPKNLLDLIQKWQIGGQEYELELEVAKPLAWDTARHVNMGKYTSNFVKFLESYIIKCNNISHLSVFPPDVLVSDLEKIEEFAAVVGALDHLVHFKALGSKEGNHRIGLGSGGSAISNGIPGALGYIPTLVSKVEAKGGLVNEEECDISNLIQVLEDSAYFPGSSMLAGLF